MINYEDLINKKGTIYNKRSNVGYQNPQQLATDLGVGTDKINWGSIAKEQPNQSQPVIPAQTNNQNTPYASPNISYENLANREGTIYNPTANKAYSTPQQLATDLGVGADQIDWARIARVGQAQPAPTPQPQNIYTVQKGDTLSQIASANGMTLQNLLSLNPQYQANPNRIDIGQSVNLSTPQQGQPVSPLATTPYADLVNKNGTIFNTKTGRGYTSPAELAQDLGMTEDQIQWGSILKEGETPLTPDQELTKKEQLEKANKAYEQLLNISPEELSTQAQLDALLEATKKGYLGTRDQAIPMEFITGQLKAIEERASLLAEPLETKMARLQAERLASSDASKFKINKLTDEIEKTEADKRYEEEKAEELRRFNISQAGSTSTNGTPPTVFTNPETDEEFTWDFQTVLGIAKADFASGKAKSEAELRNIIIAWNKAVPEENQLSSTDISNITEEATLGGFKYINEDYIKNKMFASEKKFVAAARKANFVKKNIFVPRCMEQIQAPEFLAFLMETVNQSRNSGMSDKDIEKELQERIDKLS